MPQHISGSPTRHVLINKGDPTGLLERAPDNPLYIKRKEGLHIYHLTLGAQLR